MRALLGWGVVLWAGAALLLGEVPLVARAPLAERLRPYAPSGGAWRARPAAVPWTTAVRDAAAWLARRFGIKEEAAARLARIHSPLDVTGFRLRQLGVSLVAFACGLVASTGLWDKPAVASFVALGSPLLAFLVVEQRLAVTAAARQRRLVVALPVVTEQLALLVGAGWSVGAALRRLGERGSGPAAEDLRRLSARVRQGVSLEQALGEWAALARVPALDRLVAVLRRAPEAGDLGRLLSEEARAVRDEVHRADVALMERRAQQVWVPVTVATLVPGVVFLSVPFVEALRLFTGP